MPLSFDVGLYFFSQKGNVSFMRIIIIQRLHEYLDLYSKIELLKLS